VLIPEHKIQEVLDRVDLVAVVSRYVELKKSGRSFKGKCPFHEEKSASFHVTPEIRRFKCFGCQAGGDAIAFVQRYLGKTFVDAVKDLAREAGVDLEAAVDPAARERQQLKEATDFAAEHFKARLWDAERGKKAREYLQSRGVAEKTAREFGLGWAPPHPTDLSDRLLKAGMLEWAFNAGLVKKRDRGEGFYDAFRSRLMIPIRSPEGRTIAFGGRFLELEPVPPDRKPPKYLNSRESRLYNKSEVLFGMDVAREEIRKSKAAVLVEGYFDCIALHEAGVKNAVALCSTALTPGHLGLLSRGEARELVLLLDGDEAGRKAVERLAGAILAAGFAARVAALPEKEDPDTFARRAGVEGVRALVGQAHPLTRYLFEAVLPQGADATFEDKMKALERLKPLCAQLPVGLTRSAFFGALSKHSGLPAAELEAVLRGRAPPVRPAPKPGRSEGFDGRPGAAAPSPAPAGGGFSHNGGTTRPAQPPARETSERPSGRPAAERAPDALEACFAAAVLRNPRLLDADEHRVHDELQHQGLRAVVHHVATGSGAEDALFEAAGALKTSLERASRELPPEQEVLERFFRAACRKLKLRRIEEQLAYIAKVTGRLQGASELTDDTRRLIEQRVELLELKKRLM
jgi:DNA primase